jgi:hypothetical protein
MAIIVRCYVDIDYVGEGASSALLGIAAANDPGIGPSLLAGARGNAQTLRIQQAEQVSPTATPPTSANIQAAITAAAVDLNSQLTANGSALITQIQGWYSGLP